MNGPADGECRAKIDLMSIQQSKRFENLDGFLKLFSFMLIVELDICHDTWHSRLTPAVHLAVQLKGLILLDELFVFLEGGTSSAQ
jgi:hypothetical protein